jgi:hypothetical protein
MPRLPLAAPLCALLACLAVPAVARADAYVANFSLAPAGTAAGLHSQVDMHAEFGSADPVRDLHIHLPTGLVGNPKAVPACSQADFAADNCAADTRVGTTSADATATVLVLPVNATATGYVYNVVPNADEPARLGVILSAFGGIGQVPPLPVEVALRPDGGLDTTIRNIPATVAGLPTVINSMDLHLGGATAPTFMTTPTQCAVKTTVLEAVTRADVSHSAQSSFTPTNCGAVPFAPAAAIAVADPARTKPSAYTVSLTLPDGGDPRQSHVRRASVVLPEGTTLSPGVADGLVACSAAQFAGAGCPAASQIGSVSFATPLIGTLAGKVFFGTPAGGSYPVLVAVDEHGVHLRLTGAVTLDPRTGRISTVFDNLPQVPFTAFALSFQGGDRAVLANPATCGSKALAATLTPWSGGPARTATAAFTVTGCPAGGIPFRPTLRIASDSTAAGRPADALSITIARPDGDQDLARVETRLPPGLAASLDGVPMCGDPGAATGACPAASRLGAVTAQVGSGGHPVTLGGSVYLTGPAEGGLAGLAIVLPGRVGPVDLGTVVVRAGLLLRPEDGGVTVRTSPLPAIVGGVPVSIRSLTLRLDRPGFAVNPSSCAPQTVVAALTGGGGAAATATAPYQATDCAGLAFTPQLSASIDALGPVGAKRQPEFRTVITIPPGNAATRTTTVALPSRLSLAAASIRDVCLVAQQAQDACPPGSQVGTVTAQTPLLPVPLSGPVYVAERPGELLPGLRLALGGPVQLRLNGTLGFGPNGLVSAFDGIPDVPLSRLELTFAAAGPLLVKGDPCAGTLMRVTGSLTGHNGAQATAPARVTVRGCPVTGSARVSRARRPALRLVVRKGRDARRLRSVRIVLPVRATGLRASADGRRLARRSVRVSGRTVTLRLNRAGAVTLSGRLRARSRGVLRIRATRVTGEASKLTLRAARLR